MIGKIRRARSEWRRVLRRLDDLQAAFVELEKFTYDFNHRVTVNASIAREETAEIVRSHSAWMRRRFDVEIDIARADATRLVESEAMRLESRSADLVEALRAHAQRHAEALVDGERERLQNELAVIRRNIDSLRGAGSNVVTRTESVTRPDVDPSFYTALEDRFRGSPDAIRDRQLQYVAAVRSAIDENHPLVDLGPGRGEWLGIMRSQGLPAFGIDTNPVYVKQAAALDLDVREGDLYEFLADAEPGSLGAVTLFQVVEHFRVEVVLGVFRAALAALRPGGVLIAETPNSLNVAVAASTFWLDPTHVSPIHPWLLQFMAETVGFAHTELRFSNPIEDEHQGDGLPASSAEALRKIHWSLFGAQDVALIARAPDLHELESSSG
jgi:SAM-dependent methyltransferase